MNFKRISECNKLTSLELAKYISEITQTEICKNKKYCNELVKIYLSKQLK